MNQKSCKHSEIENFNPYSVREDFPFFVNNPDVIYFDNAATTQKPSITILKEKEFYEKYNCNIFRSSSGFALRTEEMCENARLSIAEFINSQPEEIFFTYSTTYGINLLAYFIVFNYLKSGDEVILTEVEHHASLLPFMNLSKIFGFKLKLWKLNDQLELDINDLYSLVSEKTKLVVVNHMSNVLGVINDIAEIARYCREKGIMVLVDGAQGIVHNEVDVKNWGIDFYVFSAHKLYGPLGLGVVYINKKHFDKKVPPISGGSMISYVDWNKIIYLEPPRFFEAGTQALAQIFSFKYSIDYLKNIGLQNTKKYEIYLTNYLLNRMKELDFIEIYGYGEANEKRFSIIPFNVKNIHPHDVSFLLDRKNIVIRVGHHCAQLIHHKLNVSSTCRVSLAFYNTVEEVENFVETLRQLKDFWLRK